MSDRGMKKWAPYKSLTEQFEHIHTLREDRNKIEKPTISNEKAEEINSILLNHNGRELIFTIYIKGKIYKYIGVIKRIDTLEKNILLTDKTKIYLKDIIDISFSS